MNRSAHAFADDCSGVFVSAERNHVMLGLLPPPLAPCGCLHDAGDVGGYITDVLHERGIHDPILQGRITDEARLGALDLADELLHAEGVL